MGKGKGEKDVVNLEQEEELDRGNWDNQCDFFLSCLGYSSSLLPGLEEKYVFPEGIQGLGIIMSFAPLMIIILGALYQLWKRNSQGKSISFKSMTSPNEKWCSAVADKNKNRAGVSNVSYMKDDVAITNYKYEHGM